MAFDGHDLVVQVTCRTGKDRLGRPHIEVLSGPVRDGNVEEARAAMAARLAERGWRTTDGVIACPTCAKRAARATSVAAK